MINNFLPLKKLIKKATFKKLVSQKFIIIIMTLFKCQMYLARTALISSTR